MENKEEIIEIKYKLPEFQITGYQELQELCSQVVELLDKIKNCNFTIGYSPVKPS